MKTKLILPYFLFFLLISANIQSQNEASKWYFGYQCGLDFSTSPPTGLSNGALSTDEGCASISDNSGNLLFYTDGITVYNRVHAVMANGNGLKGNTSSTQSALIIKKPGSSAVYYIFTEDAWANQNGLCYSEVNMNLSAGMGSVTVKNNTLFSASWEKLTAVKHCNGSDIWVISHDANSNIFRNYLVTSAGVSSTPITSAVGIFVNPGEWDLGQMKASANGKKLGVATGQPSTFEVFDFDASIGLVSNPLTFGNFGMAYGCEFSPDGTKFYGATLGVGMFQWDLCAGSDPAIYASQVSIPTNTANIGSLQLGPDGKIYVSRLYSSYVSVINAPNAAGTACSFIDIGVSLTTGTVMSGLPNFVSSFFKEKPNPFSYTTTVCRTASFTSTPINTVTAGCSASAPPYTGVSWIFGDPASGAANTSTLAKPSHQFSAGGSYTVFLIYSSNCGSDTIRSKVTVNGCVGIEETSSEPATDLVYPNPCSNILYVKTQEPITLQIYNVSGKLVLDIFLTDGKQGTDISQLCCGIYAVRVIAGNYTTTTRVVKTDQ